MWLHVILYFEWPYHTWRVYVKRYKPPRNLSNNNFDPDEPPNLTLNRSQINGLRHVRYTCKVDVFSPKHLLSKYVLVSPCPAA